MISQNVNLRLIFTAIVAILFTKLTLSQTVARKPASWTDGSGGTISTLAELRWLSENTIAWDEDWQLSNDINAYETRFWNISANDTLGFSPIGDNKEYGTRQKVEFTGSFAGNGFSINHIYINREDENYVGFFGYTNSGSITNLELKEVTIQGVDFVGGIAGFTYNSQIYLCKSDGKIMGGEHVGGLIGITRYYSMVSNSKFTGTVNGSTFVGGLIGNSNFSHVKMCYASGKINASSPIVGGFIGTSNSDFEISNCFSLVDYNLN